MNILLVACEDDIIEAASVTYFWTTDVRKGLDVDETGSAFDSFFARSGCSSTCGWF